MLLGGSGLGKSFLASYIGYKAMENGYNVVYVTMHQLAHMLKTEEALSRSRSKMKRLRACELLILDEVGNAMLDRQEGNKLFQLLMDFYQKTSIIAISNKGVSDWARTLGGNVGTTAIMDDCCIDVRCLTLTEIAGDLRIKPIYLLTCLIPNNTTMPALSLWYWRLQYKYVLIATVFSASILLMRFRDQILCTLVAVTYVFAWPFSLHFWWPVPTHQY